MTQFGRQLVEIGGIPSGTGVMVLHYCAPAHGDIAQGHVDDFFATLVTSLDASDGSHLVSGVTMTPLPDVTIHEVDTGDLVGVFSTTEDPYTLTGAGDGSENRATHIGMKWQTNDFRNGKRVAGRTFFGPASSAAMQSDGTIAEDVVSGFPTAFSGLFDAMTARLIVWSRPKLAEVGHYSDVVGLSISQMPFLLSNRRK